MGKNFNTAAHFCRKLLRAKDLDTLEVPIITTDTITAKNFLTYGDGVFSTRPAISWSTVTAQGKPTLVRRGVVGGFSMPVYNNDNEELFMYDTVPCRWCGGSDFMVDVACYLDTANTDKNFKLQLSWMNTCCGAVVPDTGNDVPIQTATGTAAQYKSFNVQFPMNYDVDPTNIVKSCNKLSMRIRRIAADSDEITGEVVIYSVRVEYCFGRASYIAP